MAIGDRRQSREIRVKIAGDIMRKRLKNNNIKYKPAVMVELQPDVDESLLAQTAALASRLRRARR